MENLIVSVNVVLPLFIMLAIGYFVKRIGIVSDTTLKQMNNLVFRTFLPIMLFINIYNSDIEAIFNPKLLLFAFLAVIVLFFASLFIVNACFKENAKRPVLMQAIFRSNFVIFGVPIATSLYGAASAGEAAIVGALIVPMYNVFAVIVLSAFSGTRFDIKSTLKKIITNPLIIGSLAGIAFLLLQIEMPPVIVKTVTSLADVATPLAIVVLGGSFQFSKVKANKKALLFGVAARLIFVPAIMLTAAVLLGFRGVDLSVCVAMFASPLAISSFTMAQQMGADSELAGELVVFSAFFCILTIFMFVFILKQLAFL